MLVYKLEPWNKNRVKIYFDEDRPAFVLYKKELEKFDIKEGGEITKEAYDTIVNELLKKRAISRTLYLLDSCARTEEGVRRKLRSAFYPEEAIESALEYAKNRHYIDDEQYAVSFAEGRIKTKSVMVIRQELKRRGIDNDTALKALSGLGEGEKKTIERLVKKKLVNGEKPDPVTEQKIIRSLLQKGFRYDDIRSVLGKIYS